MPRRGLIPAVIAVALASACTGSSSGGSVAPSPVEDLQPSPNVWDHPLGGQGRAVSLSHARAAGKLAFAPVVPSWEVAPVRVVVMRHPAQAPLIRRLNPVFLVYRLPRSWGFASNDTRLVITERGADRKEPTTLPLATTVRLGRAVTGLLLKGRPTSRLVVGRVVFRCHGIRFDLTGPAAAPKVVLRVARDLVTACART